MFWGLGLNWMVIYQVPFDLNDLSFEEAKMHFDSDVLYIKIIILIININY